MNISISDKVPGTTVGIDSSQASGGVSAGPFKTVFMGQMTSAGSATALSFEQIFSREEAALKYGNGSILAEMLDSWFVNNNNTPVYAVALSDAAGAVKAVRDLTFTGPATAAGTIYLYINGSLTRVGVAKDDTDADIAASVAAAVNANVRYPVTAVSALGVATLTAKNGGTVHNQIDIVFNYNSGETLPAGVGVTVAVDTAGATDPDVQDALDVMPDDIINLWVTPYTDVTNLGLVSDELNERWLPTVQLDGTSIVAFDGSTSNVIAFADALNTQHLAVMDAGLNTPTPPYLIASKVAGQVALSADIDPARPFRTLPLVGALGDTLSDKRKRNERRSLLDAGCSTHVIGSDGTVRIERMVTTYKTNEAGAADESYLNLNTELQLSYARQTYINWIDARFPRHKLAWDDATFGAGQPTVTSKDIEAASIAWYIVLASQGIFDPSGLSTFIEQSDFWRDKTNLSRVNAVLAPTLMGQLYQVDATLQFRL
jgi:phage tail sheath gpL-like